MAVDPDDIGPGGICDNHTPRQGGQSEDLLSGPADKVTAAAALVSIEQTQTRINLDESEYEAICLNADSDFKYPDETNWKSQKESSLGLSPKPTFVVTALVPKYDCFPFPRNYKADNDLVNMRAHLHGLFIPAPGVTHKPSPGERIRITNKGMQSDWAQGVYLGPTNTNKRDIIKLNLPPGEASAAGESPDGSLPDRDSPVNWRAFLDKLGTKNPGTLSTLISTDREIYVDKKLDYPALLKASIAPSDRYSRQQYGASAASPHQYHKDKRMYLLPTNKNILQREQTSMLIIRESNTSRFTPYHKLDSNPLMHYNLVYRNLIPEQPNRKRKCVININIPFGLTFEENKDPFSHNAVGCILSTPGDGTEFMRQNNMEWDITKNRHVIKQTPEFKRFADKLSQWITSKELPDGSEAYVLGPWGTPGLRTGLNIDQSMTYSPQNNKSNFWQGRLVWTKYGHYYLPDEKQTLMLYELISSLIKSPPQSIFSWGYKTPRTSNYLNFNFPAVISDKKDPDYGFKWGMVGGEEYRRGRKKTENWWTQNLLSENSYKRSKVSGIVAHSRWNRGGTDGVFLEYYVLTRSLGFEHSEAWYITLAAAAETFPKEYGGVGMGPSPFPSDMLLNKYLKRGQRMWYQATNYIRGDKKPAVVVKNSPKKKNMPPE